MAESVIHHRKHISAIATQIPAQNHSQEVLLSNLLTFAGRSGVCSILACPLISIDASGTRGDR